MTSFTHHVIYMHDKLLHKVMKPKPYLQNNHIYCTTGNIPLKPYGFVLKLLFMTTLLS